MADNSFSTTNKGRNKSFIIERKSLLREYARKNYEFYGSGIVVINLLFLKTANLAELNLLEENIERMSDPTVHQAVAYIPQNNFWFKMIDLKIQKKHKIELKTKLDANKICVVLIKDDALEYFSIYTIENKKAPKAIAD